MEKKIKPYEEYKETGLPWLDKVPKQWEIKRAKAVYKKESRAVSDTDGVITCFRDGVVTLRKNRRISGFTESIKEIGYQGVRKGDLVIHVMDAFAGAIGVSDSDGKSTPVYSVCNPKVDLNNYYYAHIVREMAKTGFIQSLYRGIRERSSDFRFETFANQYLPIPPKKEQDQIVRYLDTELSKINKFIKSKKKQIQLLKEQKQAIINQAVTKGIDLDAKMKPSGIDWLGDIPEGWEVRPLKHFVKSNIETLTESFDKNATINYIDISTVGFGELKLEPVQYVFKEAPSRARRVIHVGDTIISTVRTYLKSMCYIDEELEGYIASTGFAVLTPSKEVFSKFLNYILSADYFVNMVSQNSIGVSYPAITESKLVTLKIAISPDIEEQKEILQYIKPKTIVIDKAIVAIKKEIDLITEYRTTLISNVVTGKVDVRHIEVEDIIDSIEEDFEDLDEGELIEELEMEEE